MSEPSQLAERARNAVRIATSQALALADRADDALRARGHRLARRLDVPTRTDVARLGAAVADLQRASAALASLTPGRRL